MKRTICMHFVCYCACIGAFTIRGDETGQCHWVWFISLSFFCWWSGQEKANSDYLHACTATVNLTYIFMFVILMQLSCWWRFEKTIGYRRLWDCIAQCLAQFFSIHEHGFLYLHHAVWSRRDSVCDDCGNASEDGKGDVQHEQFRGRQKNLMLYFSLLWIGF